MQAICILAHKDFKQTFKLANLMRSAFEVYIHFDTKFKLGQEEKNQMDQAGIHYLQCVNVNWGAWGIGEAAYLLMKEAIKDPAITYVHIISAQDYPVMPIKSIYQFYEGSDAIYMLSEPADEVKIAGESLLLWQKYYFNYDKLDRRTLYGKIYHRISLALQTIKRVDKLADLQISDRIYHGANWMDLPRNAVLYLLDTFDGNENLRKIFQTGYCSDEFWVQTILFNSLFKDRITQNIHRFVKWEKQHGSFPAILDETNFSEFVKQDFQFIRKVDSSYSAALIRMIDEKLL